MKALVDSKVKKAWNNEPANAFQLKALRQLATHSGRTFSVGIDQGDAWRRIGRATKQIRDPLRGQCAPPWHEAAEHFDPWASWSGGDC